MAGTAEVIVTPPPGAPLLGPIQRSIGVHDDLYARALVLNDRRQRIAILCLDLVGMAFALADEIRGAIRERTGITVTLVRQHRRKLQIKFIQICGRRAERLLGLCGCLCAGSQGFERQIIDFST